VAFSKPYMEALFHQICNTQNIADLADLLKISPLQLMRLRFEKPYFVFEVRKQTGKNRLIEAPKKEFKIVLRKLNDYLQCVYFFCRTPAAYGFVQQPRSANKKRNILTNAKRHCNRDYLLNIDLKDFFHQISYIRVINVFKSPPFNFDNELSNFLSELTTYQKRLPMGSPTSPVLSNFAARELDNSLLLFAKENNITFTRYVDDLSFSCKTKITAAHFYEIQAILSQKGFIMNTEKVNWMGEKDEKIVTGLVLKERPEVQQGFISELEANLKRYKHVLEFTSVTNARYPKDWIDQYKDLLEGKLHFLQMVYGHQHPLVKRIDSMYKDAYNTKPFMESFSWNNFPYG
jgi:RNA-directed DNA polymerase